MVMVDDYRPVQPGASCSCGPAQCGMARSRQDSVCFPPKQQHSDASVVSGCCRCSHLRCGSKCSTSYGPAPAADRHVGGGGCGGSWRRRAVGSYRTDKSMRVSNILFFVVLFAILDLDSSQAIFDPPFPVNTKPPEILTPPQNITVWEGNPFNITCRGEAAGPLSTMMLLHNGQSVDPEFIVDSTNSKKTFNQQELLHAVASAQISDSGEYLCQMFFNGEMASARAVVIVLGEGKPQLRRMQDRVISARAQVRLECIADGLPKASLEWRLPDHVSPGGPIVIDNGVITINGVRRDHGGIYECTARNDHGTDRGQVELTVIQVDNEISGEDLTTATNPPVRRTTQKKPPDVRTAPPTASSEEDGDFGLGLTDEHLIIIIAISGATIVFTLITTLVCYIAMTRQPTASTARRRKPSASPPSSQVHTDITTGTISTQSPLQTMPYDEENPSALL